MSVGNNIVPSKGAISIRNVTKVYDPGGADVMAVDDCSLEIAAGAVILESMGELKGLEGKIPHSGEAVSEFEKGVNQLWWWKMAHTGLSESVEFAPYEDDGLALMDTLEDDPNELPSSSSTVASWGSAG